MRAGSTPLHTRLRTHSSIAARPITYGSAARPVARPHAMPTPRDEPAFGAITDASPGPPAPGPTSGFTTLVPCTSWSYWRMIHALLAMFGCDSSARSASAIDSAAPTRGISPPSAVAPARPECSRAHSGSHAASRVGIGMPPCRNPQSSRPTSVPCQRRMISRVGVPKVPSSQHSTPWSAQIARTRAICAGGTASTMRSCASLIHTSVGDRPSYLVGARSRCTSAPISEPISPTALENPPAPQSVRPR